jgi:hypothetical protein
MCMERIEVVVHPSTSHADAPAEFIVSEDAPAQPVLMGMRARNRIPIVDGGITVDGASGHDTARADERCNSYRLSNSRL